MYQAKYLSECCNAEVKAEGQGDFRDNDKVVTMYYICTKCGEPCDIKTN